MTYGPETHAQACIRRGVVDCKGCGGGCQRRTPEGDWVCNDYPECAAELRVREAQRREPPSEAALALRAEHDR